MPSRQAEAPCSEEGNPPSSRMVFRGRSTTSSQGCRALELMKPGTCSRPSRSPSAVPYLDALVEEGVPDLEEDVADETVCKDHKEPVEGDEG